MADNNGVFNCGVSLPTSSAIDISGKNISVLNIRDCLVPNYIAELPYDPTYGAPCESHNSCVAYDTAYNVIQDATTGRITVLAPHAELGQSISITR